MFTSVFVHHKNILAMARECSHYVFFSPVKWKKAAEKCIFLISIRFYSYFRHISDISVDFSSPPLCSSGKPKRREKRLHWLTHSHILKFIAVRFIFLFCQLPMSFNARKIHWIIFFSLFSDLVECNKCMANTATMCVQKLNFCSWTQTKQSEKITHDNQHSVISKYMYSVCSNFECRASKWNVRVSKI